MEGPKITLYCEYYWIFRGSGMGVAYDTQKDILRSHNIFFTEDLNVSTDILQANTPGPYTWWLIKKFKKINKKVIIYAHTVPEESQKNRGLFYFLNKLFVLYLSYFYNLADIVISPSPHTVEILNKEYDIPATKTIAISNGVNLDKFKFDPSKREGFRSKNNIGNDRILVLNTAMAIPRKSPKTFIQLAKKFPDVKFIWCGKTYNFFGKKIPAHTSNLTFTGLINPNSIMEFYSAADIFIFPSHQETQGISALEAGAVGLPMIVRDIPVYDNWLKDGINCLKAKTDKEFEEKLELLLKNKELRDQLAKTLHDTVIKEHSLKAISEQLKKTYSYLLSQKND